MKKVERWRENKVRESTLSEKKYMTFTKKINDSTIMECTKMAKWLHYYGTEEIIIWTPQNRNSASATELKEDSNPRLLASDIVN